MKNIHITLTDFRNESRILKEIITLKHSGMFVNTTVIALGSEDLPIKQAFDDSTVYRINLRSKKLPKSGLFQFVKLLEFMLQSMLIIKNEKPHVVNVHALALLPLGWVLKKIFKVKLIYDAHELETEKYGLSGIRKRVSKWVEATFIKSCNLVVVVSERIADWYMDTYRIERPLVLKNAPLERRKLRRNLLRQSLAIKPQQKILIYQGGLTSGRGVDLILDAFKKRKSDDVVAVFMGYGELVDDVLESSKMHSNIFYLPAVAPNRVLDYTSSADIGIHLIQNSCLNHFYCLPNKFFEYAMAGLPVIVSNMEEMAENVNQFEFGLVLSEYSSSAINNAIDCILCQDLRGLSFNAYRFATNNSWERQGESMLSAYRRILTR